MIIVDPAPALPLPTSLRFVTAIPSAFPLKSVVERSELMHKACALAVIMFMACGLIAAQDQDFSKVQMKVTKVAGNIYMLEGAGGNIGASVGEDGIVIV